MEGWTMSELKPCPFCGGEAEMLTAESMHGGNLYGVMCNCCACRTDVFDNEAEAIEAWNTRADDYRQAAEYWQRMYEQTFAERTCHNVSTTNNFRCSECDAADFDFDKPSYCHGCGCKVVGE